MVLLFEYLGKGGGVLEFLCCFLDSGVGEEKMVEGR